MGVEGKQYLVDVRYVGVVTWVTALVKLFTRFSMELVEEPRLVIVVMMWHTGMI